MPHGAFEMGEEDASAARRPSEYAAAGTALPSTISGTLPLPSIRPHGCGAILNLER